MNSELITNNSPKKYLCLDLGTAHTGIAISEEGELAIPLTTIFERDLDLLVGRLIRILAQHNPDVLIIGSPAHGPLVKYSQDLSDKLEKVFNGQIIFYDEDLSSKKAKSTLNNSKKSVSQKKQVEHQTAAAHILQDYLDSL